MLNPLGTPINYNCECGSTIELSPSEMSIYSLFTKVASNPIEEKIENIAIGIYLDHDKEYKESYEDLFFGPSVPQRSPHLRKVRKESKESV